MCCGAVNRGGRVKRNFFRTHMRSREEAVLRRKAFENEPRGKYEFIKQCVKVVFKWKVGNL